jgi:ketosteroid isomerase-like protein
MTAMDIRSTLEALYDAFNAHDLDRIMGFFAEDCVLQMQRGKHPQRHTPRKQASRPRRPRLPLRRPARRPLWQMRGISPTLPGRPARRNGPSPAPTPDGGRLEVQGCDFYTFRDGKVIEKDSYWKIAE